jgi:hypothetical protein
MRLLDPPKPVVARRDDHWHHGELHATPRDGVGFASHTSISTLVTAKSTLISTKAPRFAGLSHVGVRMI